MKKLKSIKKYQDGGKIDYSKLHKVSLGKDPKGNDQYTWRDKDENDIISEIGKAKPLANVSKLKTVITNNPNDPRLKAYNDSLYIYNKSKEVSNNLYKLGNKPKVTTKEMEDWSNSLINDAVFMKHHSNLKKLNKQSPDLGDLTNVPFNKTIITDDGVKHSPFTFEYKKPVQPVVYQPKQDEKLFTKKEIDKDDYLKKINKQPIKPKSFTKNDKGEYHFEYEKPKPIPQPQTRQAKPVFGEEQRPYDSITMPDGNNMTKDNFIKRYGQKVWDTNYGKQQSINAIHPKMGFGGFIQNLGVGLADNALSTFGAGSVLDNAYTKDGQGRTFRGITDVTGKIQQIGGQVAATSLGGPMAGMALGQVQKGVQGATQQDQPYRESQMAGDQLAGLGQFGMQFMNPSTLKNGGQVKKTIINVEKNELLVSPDGKILKEYTNKPLHPEYGIDPRGNTQESIGNIVIPKKLNRIYKEGDRLTRHSIISNLKQDQAKRQTEANEKFMKGGKIKKYLYGSTVTDDNNPYDFTSLQGMGNPAFAPRFNNLPSSGLDSNRDFIGSTDANGNSVSVNPTVTNYNPNSNTSMFDPNAGNRKQIPWGNIGQQAGMGLLQNLGPGMYLAQQGRKYDKVNYGRVNANLLDPTAALMDADIENRTLNQNIASASGGNAGTYLNNRLAGSSANTMNKFKIRSQYDNSNAGIKNRFAEFNKNLEVKSMEDEAANKGQALTNYYQALSNIGMNTASQIRDNRAYNQDNKRMNLYSNMFPHYQFDPDTYSYSYRNSRIG
jgi:hypothetical protein